MDLYIRVRSILPLRFMLLPEVLFVRTPSNSLPHHVSH